MRWAYLGRVGYHRALALQERLRQAILEGEDAEALLLLEHPPVITLGRSARREHVLVSEEERTRRAVGLVQVGRGGDVTYHGPGQLVGYPVRRVGRAVREHVKAMVGAILGLLSRRGIEGWWEEDKPGVWCREGKIAAVGVDATGGVAIHGFALNLRPSLADFQMIVPCGFPTPVTSVEALIGERTPSLEEAARELALELCRLWGARPLEVSTESLLGGEVHQ
jgi:lipoate-protein ligase B